MPKFVGSKDNVLNQDRIDSLFAEDANALILDQLLDREWDGMLSGQSTSSPRLDRDDIILLIEECGEVIQAATKILRFGETSRYPDKGDTNVERLLTEIGDVEACVDRLKLSVPDQLAVQRARLAKHEKLERLLNKAVD